MFIFYSLIVKTLSVLPDPSFEFNDNVKNTLGTKIQPSQHRKEK